MDISRFQSSSPGELVRIEGGEHAFVPAPLPPAIELGPEQYTLLARAAEAIGEIRGLTAPELVSTPSVLLRPLQREESLRSSSLEGTYATPEELLLFELGPIESASEHDPANRWREVHNHDLALQQGEALFESAGLTMWTIRALHQTLLGGVRGQDKSPGKLRPRQVFIGSDHRFIPPPPERVPELMERLIAWWSDPEDELPPLIRTFLFHYQFEAIHPFLDGNGRVGRLLFSLMLAKRCGLGRPWLYLSAFFEMYRDEYFTALDAVSAQGDWIRWINLCLRAVIAQGAETTDRIRRLIGLRKQWLEAVQTEKLRPRTLKLIDPLFERPVLNVPLAAQIMDVAYNTARKDLDDLVNLNVLSLMHHADQRTYIAHDVMRIVHGAAR